MIRKLTADTSPATRLTTQALGTITEGYGPDKFQLAKSTLLKALEMTLTAVQEDFYGELRAPTSESHSPALSNKVFVVHGHDATLKTDVERFLHEIGMEPIVLHRQPDQGQTIIEKFEQHSDVGYAFVLLTPDEVAYPYNQDALPDNERSKEARARPNVIFEFGYFAGKLGRERVCCLLKEGVEVPTDLSGLIYKKINGSIDSQAYSIILELKAAGYKIQV